VYDGRVNRRVDVLARGGGAREAIGAQVIGLAVRRRAGRVRLGARRGRSQKGEQGENGERSSHGEDWERASHRANDPGVRSHGAPPDPARQAPEASGRRSR
jgi:hypothetical protein